MKQKPWRYLAFTVPLLLALSAADIAGTYAGVCMLGGIELNAVFVAISYAIGFAGMAALALGWWAFTGAVIARAIAATGGVKRMFIVAVFAMLVLGQAKLVMGNSLTLLAVLVEQPVPGQNEPVPVAGAYAQSFDREAFCRLW